MHELKCVRPARCMIDVHYLLDFSERCSKGRIMSYDNLKGVLPCLHPIVLQDLEIDHNTPGLVDWFNLDYWFTWTVNQRLYHFS